MDEAWLERKPISVANDRFLLNSQWIPLIYRMPSVLGFWNTH